MRTLIIIGMGFALLGLCLGAGYSFMEELPIFLLIFGAPAVIALLLRWKL